MAIARSVIGKKRGYGQKCTQLRKERARQWNNQEERRKCKKGQENNRAAKYYDQNKQGGVYSQGEMISRGLETPATVTAVYVFYVVRQAVVIIFLGSFDICV